jgi:thiosulfate dehydrogenase (quinone) large subunit
VIELLERLDERCRGAVLGIGRIMLGLLWLANIHWKVPGDFGETNGGGLYKYSASVSRNSTFAPFTWVTEKFVLPNFTFFGWFTLLTEITLALLLLVGYRTKLVALAGAAMSVPIMLSVLYYDRADEWSWSYLLMIAAHLLVYASDAGSHLGLDGVLRRGPEAARRALVPLGVVTTAIGLAGLFVGRSMSFAGRKVALLGSDAGFTNDDGSITRRWELKFVWFNPLWAILLMVCGALIIAATRQVWTARLAGFGLAACALMMLAMRTFDYVRDDGSIQKIATGSNVALFGGLALAALFVDHTSRKISADLLFADTGE